MDIPDAGIVFIDGIAQGLEQVIEIRGLCVRVAIIFFFLFSGQLSGMGRIKITVAPKTGRAIRFRSTRSQKFR